MLKREIGLSFILTFTLASFTSAQTGTPTTSPGSVRPGSFRLDIEQLKVDVLAPVVTKGGSDTRSAAAKERDTRLAAAVKAQLAEFAKPSVTIRVDPRSIAEFSAKQAENLRKMVAVEMRNDAICGEPAAVEQRLQRATLDLSTADTDARWRLAVVRVREAIASLHEAADKSYYADCGLEPAEKDEVDVIQVNASARDSLLKTALEKGFQPPQTRSDAVSLLPAIAVKTSDEAKQVGISAFDYFFSNHWRLYVRSTLTLEDDNDEETEDEATEEDDDQPTLDDVSESVRLALLDPFGGGLNVSGGYLRKIRTPFLKGDSNDLQHGFFADLRGGFKFIELPEEKLKLVDGKTTNTPFLSANAALRMILPVFKDAPGTDNPGGVEVALTGSWNRVMNAISSELFSETDGQPALLRRDVSSLHLALKLDLPDVASIQISGTLWSNSKFDKRFLIGLGLNRNNKPKPVDDSKPSATAELGNR